MFLSLPDVKWTDPVRDEPDVKVYFQSDCRAAGMKDLVREFIRKARMVGRCVCVCVCVSSCVCTCKAGMSCKKEHGMHACTCEG